MPDRCKRTRCSGARTPACQGSARRTRSSRFQGKSLSLYDDVDGNFFRIIPTDGRGHQADLEATFLGDAVGHWEQDTLVVETVKLNDRNLVNRRWLVSHGRSADCRALDPHRRYAAVASDCPRPSRSGRTMGNAAPHSKTHRRRDRRSTTVYRSRSPAYARRYESRQPSIAAGLR